MTRLNAAYKDANFRKWVTYLPTSRRDHVCALVYTYEGKTKIYDAMVVDDGRTIFRTNSHRTEPGPVHREIDKFFNLKLEF